MAKLMIDPVTRIEGHLGIELDINEGKVTEAKTHSTLFRGFERIVVGRDPRDAPIILQRICGVCHTEHRLCSLRAIENAAGVTDEIPEQAKLIRNIIEAITFMYSHGIHLYALAGPDYSDGVAKTGLTRLNFLTGQGYREAVKAQRTLHECLALLGGKAPHFMTACPGGVTLQPDAALITRVTTRVLEVKKWAVGRTFDPSDDAATNVPAVLENVLAEAEQGSWKGPDPELGNALYDLISMLAVAKLKFGADKSGIGPGRYVAMGVFDKPGGGTYMPAGFYNGSSIEPFDEKNIIEDVKHSWYTAESGGMYVGDAPPLEPDYGKDVGYSWAKAPRYKGMSAEVGPLARLVSAGLDPLDLRKTLGGSATIGSTLTRNLARTQEILWLIDSLERWLLELKPGKKTAIDYNVPNSGFGVGLWEAPRGALSHWVEIEGGKTKRYQVVAPTTWNVRPRDNNGNAGPIEDSLVNVKVPSSPVSSHFIKDAGMDPLYILQAVRSFDPCLACTVHMTAPNRRKYSVKVEHF
ncbi:periplasmic [NiFeSe] hydrogenase large subunit [archaeon BMS3Abin16]|nr:periplasmic [NiFeSe] hydrogenase large subunit [archaeon BMS3Abin16]GBE57056.1 periplasmic [NiFeSe] hydrogenase large subunit [archaeon BMS3Bbin16]